MPWCGPCERFLNPSTLNPDGTCPVCGAAAEVAEAAGGEGSGEEEYRAPWHFRLMVVATVLYVGWRIVQLVARGWGA